MSRSIINSAIYQGAVRHRRFAPTEHKFTYSMYMLALDLDDVEQVAKENKYFSNRLLSPLRFRREDYFGDKSQLLKQSVLDKAEELGGDINGIDRVLFLGQVRCFGIYFSPVNFYFCYRDNHAVLMIAEVSNTPWNETHCYLVNLDNPMETEKAFHVSPFMDLNMSYHWHIKAPENVTRIHIENWKSDKVFDATLTLKRETLNNQNTKKLLKQWPLMNLSILKGIYWQAFHLFRKKLPIYSHA
ncbi:MAG: DUF1365 domain-containing protein [Gammaproteobacteria bacterium]|nr:DUF1365 domain-containing protein [Gammaproteobacteria bacterium]